MHPAHTSVRSGRMGGCGWVDFVYNFCCTFANDLFCCCFYLGVRGKGRVKWLKVGLRFGAWMSCSFVGGGRLEAGCDLVFGYWMFLLGVVG